MNINTNQALPVAHAAARVCRSAWALLADRVILAFIAGLLLLAVVDRPQAQPSLVFAFESLLGIGVFLLIAVGLAAYTRASGADGLIARAFSGHPARSIVVAALAGALSPFCSCGVVPVIAALLRARVPLAPVMAFWIASPVMDPEMFILTAAGISLEFAVAKTLATLAMGLGAGHAIYLMGHHPVFSDPLRGDNGRGGCAAPLSRETVSWRFWVSAERRSLFRAELASMSMFLGKWLLLAFFLESLMIAYIPADQVAALLGSGGWHEVPLAAVIGVPAYLNGYAAIPLVGGLLEMGMNPGAAMAFMTAGAVSSIPAAMAVAVLVKRPVLATYLGLGLAGSMLTAFLYGAFV